MHLPTVTVAMPNFNMAGLLVRAMDAVLGQTVTPTEFLIPHHHIHPIPSRLCNLRSGNSVGGTAKLRLLGIPYSWSSIHPGGPIALQET
jgi:hypothetical protein